MRKSCHIPDLVNSVAAFLVGLIFALFFHVKWYYGGWLAFFGDPPSSNPAYSHFLHLFEVAPYVAAGIGSGLIAGFGSPRPIRILIRFAGVVVLFLFFETRNHHLAFFAFLPISFGLFLFSTTLSGVYFWLLNLTKEK